MARRLALLIGNTTFDDTKTFPNLRTPANDARDFAAVLQKYGHFEILNILVDETVDTIRQAIEDLFTQAERGDLTLFYYSGHGYLDRRRQHYLIARNSSPGRLLTTGIRETFIRDAMSDSRSRHRVIILDCCFSGAFIKGRKSGSEPLLLEKLKGEASAILVSSGNIQYSFEEEGQNSLFTQYLIQGIESGQAGHKGRGYIPIDELFYYAEQRVRDARPEQTPMIELCTRESEIYIATSPKGNKFRGSREFQNTLSESVGNTFPISSSVHGKFRRIDKSLLGEKIAGVISELQALQGGLGISRSADSEGFIDHRQITKRSMQVWQKQRNILIELLDIARAEGETDIVELLSQAITTDGDPVSKQLLSELLAWRGRI